MILNILNNIYNIINMDLTQQKLTKGEWEFLEIPVTAQEEENFKFNL